MFTFTQDCLIGIEQLDKEHEYLFQLLNEAFGLLENDFIKDKYERICELLERLKEYADTHFEHEEDYMRSMKDPELEIQKKQHMAFRERIDRFSFANIDENQDGVLSEILEYMTRWLYNHILSSDMMIGKMQSLDEWRGKEAPCAFSKEYLTGIAKVDEQHKRLFEIIGETNELVNNEFIPDKFDNIIQLLEELTDYTKIHFADEEAYMEKIGYAGIDAQKRAHAGFTAKLEDIKLDGIDGNQQEVLLELLDFLFNWLVYHILKMDKLIPVDAQE